MWENGPTNKIRGATPSERLTLPLAWTLQSNNHESRRHGCLANCSTSLGLNIRPLSVVFLYKHVSIFLSYRSIGLRSHLLFSYGFGCFRIKCCNPGRRTHQRSVIQLGELFFPAGRIQTRSEFERQFLLGTRTSPFALLFRQTSISRATRTLRRWPWSKTGRRGPRRSVGRLKVRTKGQQCQVCHRAIPDLGSPC